MFGSDAMMVRRSRRRIYLIAQGAGDSEANGEYWLESGTHLDYDAVYSNGKCRILYMQIPGFMSTPCIIKGNMILYFSLDWFVSDYVTYNGAEPSPEVINSD